MMMTIFQRSDIVGYIQQHTLRVRSQLVGAGSAGGVGFKVTLLSFMRVKYRAERNVVLTNQSAKTAQHNINERSCECWFVAYECYI